MALNDTHQQYSDYVLIWNKCRDVVQGQEKIHSQGEIYLAKLSGQNRKEYLAYVDRTLFYNATQRTSDAMVGLLFRKDPQRELPDAVEDWTKNIDLNGNSLDYFAQDISTEILEVGRVGILVDFPNNIGEIVTQADAEKENARPFMVKYKAEDIINWSTTTVDNIKTLSLVVLKEKIEVATEQEFEFDCVTQYRVLDLFEGNYRQRVFQQPDERKKVFNQIGEDIFPQMNGTALHSIPFFFLGPKNIDDTVKKPPILDLVNVNLSHYKTTADLEHGAHFTGLPTPVVSGHRMTEGETLRVGSGVAWVFAEPEAKAYYLEYLGQGLDNLQKLLDSKEQKMAALGARLLANEKAQAETAEAHLIKRQGENSALSCIADTVSLGMTKALKLLISWGGFDSTDVDYKINKDFIPTSMTAQDLTAILGTWQAGGMAFSDFIDLLKKGELIAPDRTPEDIQSERELEGPRLGEDPNADPNNDTPPDGKTDPASKG